MAILRKKDEWNLDNLSITYQSKKMEECIKMGRKGDVIPEAEVDKMMMGSKPVVEKIKTKKKVADDDGFEEYLSKGSLRGAGLRHSTSSTTKDSGWTPCHASHPPLKIPVGEKVYEIYGGSCIHPKINDMDVFVGLDSGMAKTSRAYPWYEGTELLFHIQDMQVPKDVEEFKKLLNYLKKSLEAGKKVFVGCIGGHGRTGTVFSALVKLMSNIEDSTTYVRENYCKKVVESQTQVDWLHTHFGIKKVEATKGGYSKKSTDWAWDEQYSKNGSSVAKNGVANGYAKSTDFCTKSQPALPMPVKGTLLKPVACAFSIHGENQVARS